MSFYRRHLGCFAFSLILTSSPEHLKPSLRGDINSLRQSQPSQLEAGRQSDHQVRVVQVSKCWGLTMSGYASVTSMWVISKEYVELYYVIILLFSIVESYLSLVWVTFCRHGQYLTNVAHAIHTTYSSE